MRPPGRSLGRLELVDLAQITDENWNTMAASRQEHDWWLCPCQDCANDRDLFCGPVPEHLKDAAKAAFTVLQGGRR